MPIARIVNTKDFDKPKTEINPIGSNEEKDFAGQIVKIANSINSVLGTFKNMIGEAAEIKEAYKKINSKEEKPIQQAQPIQPMQTENSIKGEPKTIEVKKVIETPIQEVPEQKETDYNKVAAVLFERLKAELDIPVFHDDQHGTAIVTTAALINSCRLSGRKLEDLEIVLSGTGAAGSSIARLLKDIGVKKVYGYNLNGVILKSKYESYSFLEKELIDQSIIDTPENLENDTLKALLKNKDVFIGVSAKGLLTKDMVMSMNKDSFIFAMANPDPEIMPDVALEANAYVVGTGRSDFPNQINNVLAFPGLFRGVLNAKSKSITESMKIKAAQAIAYIIKDDELRRDYIIPSPFDKRVVEAVSKAIEEEVYRLNLYRT